MTELDGEVPQDVLDAIDGKDGVGVPASFSRETTSYNPATGAVAQDAASIVTRKVSPPAQFDREFINGTTVLATDLQIILPGLGLPAGFEPAPGMVCEESGRKYQIISVTPLRSGTLVAAYEIQLRG